MIEAPGDTKGLVRLLQFLLRGPAVQRLDGASRVLTRADGASRRFSNVLVEACARRGLITVTDGSCRALPEAKAALRRLVSAAGMEHMGQHAGLAEEERVIDGRRSCVLVNRDSTVLMQLARLKDRHGGPWFPAEAIAAGERLAADFQFAGLQPRITASWTPRLDTGPKTGRGGQAELSDSIADARRRIARAASVLGPELSGVALDVCCFSKGLELVERERNWPARSAKLMLRAALMALARHYGMIREGRGERHDIRAASFDQPGKP